MPDHICIYLARRLRSAPSKLSASSFLPPPIEAVIFDKQLVPEKKPVGEEVF